LVSNVPGAARAGRRDVRGVSDVLAGTFPFEVGDETVTGWHSHDLHQLEYAFQGVAQARRTPPGTSCRRSRPCGGGYFGVESLLN